MEMAGDQSNLPEQPETNAAEKAFWNVELGAGDDFVLDDLADVVDDGRLEIREEQVQIAKFQGE